MTTIRLADLAGAVALLPPAPALAATVHVYFCAGEHGAAVHRWAPPRSPARAAVQGLLTGPSPAERRRGLTSAVPDGTRLLGLSVRRGVADVDLTRRFASGGGSLSMTLRLAQLVYTVTAVPGVDRVRLLIEGRPVHALGGEGLILRQPLARGDYRAFFP